MMKDVSSTLKFVLRSYFQGCFGCLGASTLVAACILLLILFSGPEGWHRILSSLTPQARSTMPAGLIGAPPIGSNTTFTPASTPTGILPSLQIWFTKDNNPDAPAVTSFKYGELNQAFVWVRGPQGASVAFDLWMTMPDGGRERFGPTYRQFRTDPEGKPVSTGSGGPPPMRGTFKIEAIIGSTTVGSTTVTVQ